MGIIIGTALAGFLKSIPSNAYFWVGCALVGIATVGFAFSLFIEKTEAKAEKPVFEINPFKEVWRSVRFMCGIDGLLMVLIGTTFFWLMGAMFQLNIILYAKQLMGLDDRWTSSFLVVFGLGIGTGSALAGVLSKGRIRLEFSLRGAVGLVLGLLCISLSYHSLALSYCSLGLLSVSAGFFIVPLNAFLQRNCPVENRGRCIAAMNVVNYLGMLLAGALLYLSTDLIGLNAGSTFLLMGGLSIGVLLYLRKEIPRLA
jgi:acyl-[acyl-carrier-protein]-phospholipid O-acyltransferase/long-chain-fatty-acid--[acyl-carrier-protein] ligase